MKKLFLALLLPVALFAQPTQIRVYKTISEMVATAAPVPSNQPAYVLGYNSPNDHGGGIFVPTNTATGLNPVTRFLSALSPSNSFEKVIMDSTVNAAAAGLSTTATPDQNSAAISNALSFAKHVVISPAPVPYTVSPISLSGTNWNGKVLELEAGAVLVMKTNYTNGENVLSLDGISGFKICGAGTIKFQTSTAGEHSHDISIQGCTNVIVEGVTLGPSSGDGLDIGIGIVHPVSAQYVRVTGVHIIGSKRNGISPVGCIHCEIDHNIIEDVGFDSVMGYTPPGAGIDEEPDLPNIQTDVNVHDNIIRHCASIGILVESYGNTNNPVSLSVLDNHISECSLGLTIESFPPRTLTNALVLIATGNQISDCPNIGLNLGLMGTNNTLILQGQINNSTNTGTAIGFTQNQDTMVARGWLSGPKITADFTVSGVFDVIYQGGDGGESKATNSFKRGCVFNIDNTFASTGSTILGTFPDEGNEWVNFTAPITGAVNTRTFTLSDTENGTVQYINAATTNVVWTLDDSTFTLPGHRAMFRTTNGVATVTSTGGKPINPFGTASVTMFPGAVLTVIKQPDGSWYGTNFFRVQRLTTGNRAVVTDSNGDHVVGSATDTQVNYLNNVTSDIQTQLNSKVGTTRAVNTSGSLTGGGNLSADRTFSLVNDNATPGATRYYGTDSGGTKGFFSIPSSTTINPTDNRYPVRTNSTTFGDGLLLNEGSNILSLNNGSNAEEFRIYGSTNGGNYERLSIKHNGSGSGIVIDSQAGGTGTVRPLNWAFGGTTRMNLGITGTLTLSPATTNDYIFFGTGFYADASGRFELNANGGGPEVHFGTWDTSSPFYLKTARTASGSFFSLFNNTTPIFDLQADGTLDLYGNVFPMTDNSFTLGGSANRWANLFTSKTTYATSLFDTSGSGTPEGSVTAVVGSTYRRSDGGAGTTLYVKESGSGNTGWSPASTANKTYYTVLPITNPSGAVTTGTTNYWPLSESITIKSVTARLLNPSTSGSVTMDLAKNGTTVLSSPVSLTAGTTNTAASVSVTSGSAGNVLVGFVTAAGANAAGATLVIGYTTP